MAPRLARTALVLPPHWYYASVPGDLLYTGSHLRAAGVPTTIHDLSAGLSRALLGGGSGYQAFRRRETYQGDRAYVAAGDDVSAACRALSARHRVRYSLTRLEFPDIDEGHLPAALAVGLDPTRNLALPYLEAQAVPALLAGDPELIGLALVHPDQIVQVPVLARLLRRAGYRGFLCLYGAYEDVVAPEDFAEDLVGEPRHLLFDDLDGVIVGEAETPLRALAAALTGARDLTRVPGLLAPAHGAHELPRAAPEDVNALAAPDFSLVDPSIYPFPMPVVDLRLSRSCPWARCTFCAITSHQAGYRARRSDAIVREMTGAHETLGAIFFRFRDDLLTPAQLREIAALVPSLPFRPRWTARARFENGLSRETLVAAAAAGLEELWLGLESAVPRVRNLMVKGVAQGVAERILVDAEEAGIRVRALCLVGYPGETVAEARATLDFLHRHMFRVSTSALTPFQLMRNAPLGREPARYGLRVRPDDKPRAERIRYRLELEDGGGMTRAEVDDLVREGRDLLGGWMIPEGTGPSLSHAWMRASAARRSF